MRIKRGVRTSGNGAEPPVLVAAKTVAQKRAFLPAEVALIEDLLTREGTTQSLRDCTLFRVGVDTLLRASDLLQLTVGDVLPDPRGSVVEDFTIRQQKTGRAVRCALSEKGRAMVSAWLHAGVVSITHKHDRLFAISDRQYRNIIKRLAKMIKLNPADYSTHSVRRTKSKAIYAQTKNLGAVRVLLGHTSLGATAAYLGIDAADALEVAKSVDI